MLPQASFLATSSEGSRTSQVAKLLRQKYLTGMFALFRRSSKVYFFNPASLLVLRSVTTKDRVFGSTSFTIRPCNPLILDNRLFHSLYILEAGYKDCDPMLRLKSLNDLVLWILRTNILKMRLRQRLKTVFEHLNKRLEYLNPKKHFLRTIQMLIKTMEMIEKLFEEDNIQ